MQCPVCKARTKRDFCRYCGHQMPVIVGQRPVYGLRFPDKHTPENIMQFANATRAFAGLRTALYDITRIDRLLDLNARLVRAMGSSHWRLIEHTTDGKTFRNGQMPWRCFGDMLAGRPLTSIEVPHLNVQCHSYFGCVYAQERQPRRYHQLGVEIFYHGIHGHFRGVLADDAVNSQCLGKNRGQQLYDTHFLFDKAAIKQQVVTLVKKFGADWCPKFSQSRLNRQIDALPQWIIPSEDDRWGLLWCRASNRPAVYFRCYQRDETEYTISAQKGDVLCQKNILYVHS